MARIAVGSLIAMTPKNVRPGREMAAMSRFNQQRVVPVCMRLTFMSLTLLPGWIDVWVCTTNHFLTRLRRGFPMASTSPFKATAMGEWNFGDERRRIEPATVTEPGV